jgi:hypothetical protein
LCVQKRFVKKRTKCFVQIPRQRDLHQRKFGSLDRIPPGYRVEVFL